MHLCIGNLTIIGSDNGLLAGRPQAIIWTNAEELSIGHWGTKYSKILIEIYTSIFMKMHLKMSGKWWPFCLRRIVITQYITHKMAMTILIARFMGPTWGPSGADRTQVAPVLAPWTLLSGKDPIKYMGDFEPIKHTTYLILNGELCDAYWVPLNQHKLQQIPKLIFFILSCRCLWPSHWSQVLSREWRCSWSSANIWVINNFIAY